MFYRALQSDLFEKVDVKKICDNCLKRKIRTRCRHCPPPKWISRDKDEDIKVLLGDANVEEEEARELVGIYIDDTDGNKCIPNLFIERLFSIPRTKIEDTERVIYIAIDPAGGSGNPKKSDQSDIALMAMTERHTIIGLESISITEECDITRAYSEIARFIRDIRKHPFYFDAWLCIAIESNYGNEAPHIKSYIESQKGINHRLYFMSDNDVRTGVHLSHNKKQRLIDETIYCLSENFVSFATDLIGKNIAVDFSSLKEQLGNIEYVHTPTTSQGIKITKTTISGKKNNKTKDDLATVFCWLMYIRFEFLDLARYRKARSIIYT